MMRAAWWDDEAAIGWKIALLILCVLLSGWTW